MRRSSVTAVSIRAVFRREFSYIPPTWETMIAELNNN